MVRGCTMPVAAQLPRHLPGRSTTVGQARTAEIAVGGTTMRMTDLEPFKDVPFYLWAKDEDGVYLWGSAEMDRFAGGPVAGRTDAEFGQPAESPPTAATLQANDREVLDSGSPLYTHEQIEGAGNVSVCKWPGELDGRRVTFGVSFLVPGD